MKLPFQRVIAATIPLAMFAGSTLSASASVPGGQHFYRSFGLRNAAAPVVLGGGATLPIPAYLGKSVNGGYEGSGTTSFGAAGSVFGYFASQAGGLNVEYCATGSGKGKGVFDGVANTVDTPCANAANPNATTFGFLPPSNSPTQTYPTLAGTDAPLAQSDYSAYTMDHAAPLEPVELPSLYGSIAIYYNDPTLAAPQSRITLSDAQICGVYNGTYTTFGQLTGNSNDTTKIIPVYRADGSGTSFNFSNHLATLCAGYNGNQTFTLADPKLPAGSFGATGNGGMVTAVTTMAGAIAYVEAGYLTNVPGGTGTINYANVKNTKSGLAVDPFAGLPTAANAIPSSVLQTNVQVIQGTGPATTQPLTGVRSGSCVKVVPPAAYANPAAGYPIVAVTYLLTNSGTNGSVGATGLRLLEKDLSTPALFKGGSTPKITTADAATVKTGTTGYSSLGSTFGNIITATANSCINV